MVSTFSVTDHFKKLSSFRHIVKVSESDFETYVPGSILTEALRFRQETHSELKCYSVQIKSSSKYGWSGRHCPLDSYVTSNPAISD